MGVEMGEVLPEPSERPVRVRSSRRSQTRPNTSLGVWIAVAVGLSLGIVALVFVFVSSRDDSPTTARRTVPEKRDSKSLSKTNGTTDAKLARAVAKFESGRDHVKHENWDAAITDFTEAIRLKPDLAEAYFIRGVAYNERGEQAKAIADFAKAKALGFKP